MYSDRELGFTLSDEYYDKALIIWAIDRLAEELPEQQEGFSVEEIENRLYQDRTLDDELHVCQMAQNLKEEYEAANG